MAFKGLSKFGRKVGTRFAAKSAAKTVSRGTLLKAIGGTAIGTYVLTVYNGFTSVTETIAEALGVPDWAATAVIAAVLAIVVVIILSKIADIISIRRYRRAELREYARRHPVDRRNSDRRRI